MKKYTLTPFLILTLVSVALISCDKDNDPAPAKTKTELISSGSWKFSTATVSGIDVSGMLQTCQKDNIITFTAAGLTGIVDEGLTKCNTADPQQTPFTWSFNTGETELNITTTLFTGGSGTFTLVSLTETQLVVSQQISGQTAIVTFIH